MSMTPEQFAQALRNDFAQLGAPESDGYDERAQALREKAFAPFNFGAVDDQRPFLDQFFHVTEIRDIFRDLDKAKVINLEQELRDRLEAATAAAATPPPPPDALAGGFPGVPPPAPADSTARSDGPAVVTRAQAGAAYAGPEVVAGAQAGAAYAQDQQEEARRKATAESDRLRAEAVHAAGLPGRPYSAPDTRQDSGTAIEASVVAAPPTEMPGGIDASADGRRPRAPGRPDEPSRDPSRVGLEADTPGAANNTHYFIATTGDVIDIVTRDGKTNVKIPRTEGMSYERRCKVASNLVAAAISAGCYELKNGKPHFKIDTKDYILRAAIEEQVKIIGGTFDSASDEERNKEREAHARADGIDRSLMGLGSYVGGGLPDRYDRAIEDAKASVRRNNIKGSKEYAAIRAQGVAGENDKTKIRKDDGSYAGVEPGFFARKGFFDQYISGADDVIQNSGGNDAQKQTLLDEFMRRPAIGDDFGPDSDKAAQLFVRKDAQNLRKAGDYDRQADGSIKFKYIKNSDGSDFIIPADRARGFSEEQIRLHAAIRLRAIARHGLIEGNLGQGRKPPEVRNMKGQDFARAPVKALAEILKFPVGADKPRETKAPEALATDRAPRPR